jgi:hypothetical protein
LPFKCNLQRYIAPLHQRSHVPPEEAEAAAAAAAADADPDGGSKAAAPLDVDAKPQRIALALSSAGSLVHCVRIVDATKRWEVVGLHKFNPQFTHSLKAPGFISTLGPSSLL